MLALCNCARLRTRHNLRPVSTFHCTRCGALLRGPSGAGVGRVRCGHCGSPTRVPPRADDLPVAAVAGAGGDNGNDGVPVPSYVPAWLDRHERNLQRDAIAERLHDVRDDTEGDLSRMTECRFCGTTIAPFVRTCPSCRHPLWGG